MTKSRAQTTATNTAQAAAGLRLADRSDLTDELARLERALGGQAARAQRAEALNRRVTRDVATLQRLLPLAQAGTASRTQHDVIAKLVDGVRTLEPTSSLDDQRVDQDAVERAQAVRSEVHHRDAIHTSTLVRAAVTDPPDHLTRILGPPPSNPDHRVAWDRAALTIETYRHRYAPQLRPDQPGLGPNPTSPGARRAWQRSQRQLDRALDEIAPPFRLEATVVKLCGGVGTETVSVAIQ